MTKIHENMDSAITRDLFSVSDRFNTVLFEPMKHIILLYLMATLLDKKAQHL